MLNSEKYASILVCSLLLGGLLFCFASIYTQTYHETYEIGMTVSVSDNGYMAEKGVYDVYPYYPEKSQFFGEQFNSDNASQVLQWAIDNANDIQIKQGNYYLYNTVKIDSYSNLDGGNAKFLIGIANGTAFSINNGHHVSMSNFWFESLP